RREREERAPRGAEDEQEAPEARPDPDGERDPAGGVVVERQAEEAVRARQELEPERAGGRLDRVVEREPVRVLARDEEDVALGVPGPEGREEDELRDRHARRDEGDRRGEESEGSDDSAAIQSPLHPSEGTHSDRRYVSSCSKVPPQPPRMLS